MGLDPQGAVRVTYVGFGAIWLPVFSKCMSFGHTVDLLRLQPGKDAIRSQCIPDL